MSRNTDWQRICAVDDILPDTGVCALVEGRQIAIFRLRADDSLHGVDVQIREGFGHPPEVLVTQRS